MKRYLCHYVFTAVILVILVIPITTTVYQGSNNNNLQTEPAKNKQDTSVVSSDWLSGWGYRKSHQILGTPGAGVDYQVEITVNFGTGTDSDNIVYCDSNCQPDFDDIRFTDDDGYTLLDYWTENVYESDNATFWIEVKDDLDFDTTIHMYYGNSTVSTLSNGTATFIMFDDFDEGYLAGDVPNPEYGWNETLTYDVYVQPNPAGKSGLGLCLNTSLTPGYEEAVNDWDRGVYSSVAVHYNWYCDRVALRNGHIVVRGFQDGSQTTGFETHWQGLSGVTRQYFVASSTYEFTPACSYESGSWYQIEDYVAPNHYHSIMNGTRFDGETRFADTPSISRLLLNTYVDNSHGDWFTQFDDLFVRKWIEVEPTHGAWSDGESWLDGWNFRTSHEIIGSIGAGENYQIEIVVHYGFGTNINEDVYCGEQCQSDFDDIRFTDDDGITLLDYWRETNYESDSATFWVEVKDNLDTSATIYMYYGNPSCDTTSNGTATFIFFDDFESTSLGSDPDPSKWWLESAQDADDYVRIASDPVDGGNQVAEASETGDSIANVAWANDWGSVGNIAIGHKFRYDVDYKGYYTTKDASHTFIFIEQLENLGENNHQWYEADVDYFDYSPSLVTVTDEWYSWEYRFFEDEMTLLDRDNSVLNTGGYCFPATINETRTTCTRYGLLHGANTWWTDDMYVRKFVSSEPTHGTWGDSILSWHHDCSDTTGFVYNDTWNMNWMTWDITPGSLTSDGTSLTIAGVATGSDYHGPVYEYELPQNLRVRDIDIFSAIMNADNSISSYLGYEVVMLGDADRNPVLFFSFGDGWSGSTQGAYGISYVFEDGSRVGYGSGYPITWSSFNGEMNVSYTESGLMAYVEGIGQELISGLTEADFNREVKYVALASARFGSDPLFPLLVDELSLNYVSTGEPPIQASINDVEDFWYEASESGNVIEWTIANFNPSSYELWRDEGLLTSESWPGGTTIEFDIDNLSPGDYNYTIVVYGDFGAVVSDTVIVTVMDLTIPSLGHPPDAVYEYGTSGHAIIWSVSDLYPGEYIVNQDVTVIETDSWTSGSIIIDTDGLAIGVYTYMIIVTDSSGNFAIDMVTITVVDTTAPILNHPSDIIGDIALANIQVSWQPTDFLPFNYSIYENGAQVDSGTWTNGDNLTYTIDDLTTSSYNITIVVWDTSGNYARDTVLVNIEEGSIEPIGDYLVVTISIGSMAVIVVIIGLICKNKGGAGGAQATSPDPGYSW